jgi:putative transposase
MSLGWFYGFFASQPVSQSASQHARDQRQVGREARDMRLLPKIKTFFRASKKMQMIR